MRMRLIFLALLLTTCGCGYREPAEPAEDPAAETVIPVDLALNWYPEAEHGGYYAALVHGYYRAAGLDVTIHSGGPNAPVIQRVASGAVTFGIENADGVLLGRAEEADVVAVMAPLQTSPRCIMVHQSSGIRSFDELKWVTLAMSESAGFAKFLRRRLPLEDVRIVPNPGNVALFLQEERFAQQAYVFSEPFVVGKEGGQVRSLMVSDLGYNPYTSLLVVHGDTIRGNPELVRKMVEASVRGWRKYLEDPEETNRYINPQNPEMELDILAYGVETMRPLCLDESTPPESLGRMTQERWQTLLDQLIEIGEIERGTVEAEAAFTTKFLPLAAPPERGRSE